MIQKLLTAAFAVLFSSVLYAGEEAGSYRKISAEKAHKMIAAGGVTLVDVRTPDEYSAGHIPGAVLVPLQTLDKDALTLLTDKNAVLLVYCRTGRRSETASRMLLEMGYQNVYDIAGGITQWPFETVKGTK